VTILEASTVITMPTMIPASATIPRIALAYTKLKKIIATRKRTKGENK
jgi:hypothetical protein